MVIREVLAAILFVLGAFVFVTATIGILKFKYVMNRMHAAALGDTLGIMCFVLGGVIYCGISFVSLKMVLALVLLWFTSPVATHFIAALEFRTNNEAGNKEYKEMKIEELRKEAE